LMLSSRGWFTPFCMDHLTATTVRVGMFMPGLIDSLPFLSASPNKPPGKESPRTLTRVADRSGR
jgi:hypothetical protein